MMKIRVRLRLCRNLVRVQYNGSWVGGLTSLGQGLTHFGIW